MPQRKKARSINFFVQFTSFNLEKEKYFSKFEKAAEADCYLEKRLEFTCFLPSLSFTVLIKH